MVTSFSIYFKVPFVYIVPLEKIYLIASFIATILSDKYANFVVKYSQFLSFILKQLEF